MKILLTFLLILCCNKTILHSQTPDEVLSKKLIEKYLNTKIDNTGLIDTDGSVYKIHKTMSIRDTGKVNYFLTVLVDTKPKEVCRPCPVDVLILEWMIDKPNDTILRFNKLKIESSGTFGDINGIFEYKLLSDSYQEIPVLFYHDNRVEDGKGLFRFHNTYIISQGKIIDSLYQTFYSNEENRVIHKNNIIDCKSKFVFDNNKGFIRYVKTGKIYDSLVYEESLYSILNQSIHRILFTNNKNDIEYKGLVIRFIDMKDNVIPLSYLKEKGKIGIDDGEGYMINRIEFIPKKNLSNLDKIQVELYCVYDGYYQSDDDESCYKDDSDQSDKLLFKTNLFNLSLGSNKRMTFPIIPWTNYNQGYYRIKVNYYEEYWTEVGFNGDNLLPITDILYLVTQD